jgi:hypothetical protein
VDLDVVGSSPITRPNFLNEALAGSAGEKDMKKYSCTMSSGSLLFYATLIAENDQQAREIAIAETKRGEPREWSVRVLEADVEGPARSLSSGHRNN